MTTRLFRRVGFAAALAVALAAFTGRAEYLGVRGLTAGAALWRGTSRVTQTPELNSSVLIGEADARYRRGRLELRG